MENHAENVHLRLFPDPFLTLGNNLKKPLKEILLKIRYFESLKKLFSFFLLKPVPFNGQSYLKQNGPGTSDLSLLGYKTSSEKFLY